MRNLVAVTGHPDTIANLKIALIVIGVILIIGIMATAGMRFWCPNLLIWACTKYDERQILKLKRSYDRDELKKKTRKEIEIEENSYNDATEIPEQKPMYIKMEKYRPSPFHEQDMEEQIQMDAIDELEID